MHGEHCGHGERLYDIYQQKFLDFAIADGERRLNGSGGTQADRLTLELRMESEKAEYEKARCDYIAHVVDCRACAWDQLAHSYLEAMEHSGARAHAGWMHAAHT